MKRILTIAIAIFMAFGASAQAPEQFSYQAVIRDAQGDLVSKQSVTVNISILEGNSTGTTVFEEEHTVTTNDNGLATLIIGNGLNTLGDIASVSWGDNAYYLKIETDPEGGNNFSITATTQLLSVPYALYANEAGSGSGALEEITEGPNTGYRIVGRDTANYGDIGDNAVDLSYSSLASTTNGASGDYSTAMGFRTSASGGVSTAMGGLTTASGDESTAMGGETEASGDNSTAMGYGTTASGGVSTAMGNGTTASGGVSTAMGFYTDASGDYSTAMGDRTIASGDYSTAMGDRTIASGDYSTAMVFRTTASGDYSTAMGGETEASGDYSTAMGNNTTASGNFSTAMGDFTTASGVGSTAMGYNTTASGQESTAMGALTTASGNYSTATGISTSASGTSSTVMGNSTTASGTTSTAMGLSTTASGNYSTAMGYNTEASGATSTAMGYDARASGDISTAMGTSTRASGDFSTATGISTSASGNYSTAMGYNTEASGNYSTAMGTITTASGVESTAMGSFTTAPSAYETVIGRHNTSYTPLDSVNWNAGDRLLVVGNGLSASSRSDALVILKNGNVGIGNSDPEGQLFVQQSFSLASSNDGIYVDINGDNWKTYHSGLHYSFGNMGVRQAYVEDNTGNYVQPSDKNLKTNIETLPSVMDGVLRLNPVSYVYKSSSDPNANTIGFLAQEVGEVFPDVVRYAEDGTPGLAYDLFSILSIKAIQEQQAVIDEQQVHIADQKQQIESLIKEINAVKNMLRDIQLK